MRESLKRSLDDSAVRNQERYAKGSVVLCNACALPVFKLDRAILVGDGGGKTASALVPLTPVDLQILADREDIDGGVRATIKGWTPEQRLAHTQKLHDVKAGDPMLCPCCSNCFVQVLAVTKHEVLDKAYVM